MAKRERAHIDFAAILKSLSNIVPPVHPRTAVQYVSGIAQMRSTLLCKPLCDRYTVSAFSRESHCAVRKASCSWNEDRSACVNVNQAMKQRLAEQDVRMTYVTKPADRKRSTSLAQRPLADILVGCVNTISMSLLLGLPRRYLQRRV